MSDDAGVYGCQADGSRVLIHSYQEGDYHLADVAEIFGLGRIEATGEGELRLDLEEHEARQLRSLALAQSFDQEPGLIELCLALHHFCQANPGNRFGFLSFD